MKKVENGSQVSVHYRGTFEDGTEFDNSQNHGGPMMCHVGSGQLIPGFENALSGMSTGETKSVSIPPGEAYGEVNPDAIQTVSRDLFPSDFELKEGATVYGTNSQGQEMMAKIESFDDENAVLDFNHPMAGKTLNFEISVVEIA